MGGGDEVEAEIEAAKKELAAEAGQAPTETFGISLTSQRLSEDGDEAALAAMMGGFTLEASVVGAQVEPGESKSYPLAKLRVVPGGRSEHTYGQVAFSIEEGSGGQGRLQVSRHTGDLVAGRISGTLYAAGYVKQDGSKPMIRVEAEFVALPGPLSCMTGDVSLPF